MNKIIFKVEGCEVWLLYMPIQVEAQNTTTQPKSTNYKTQLISSPLHPIPSLYANQLPTFACPSLPSLLLKTNAVFYTSYI